MNGRQLAIIATIQIAAIFPAFASDDLSGKGLLCESNYDGDYIGVWFEDEDFATLYRVMPKGNEYFIQSGVEVDWGRKLEYEYRTNSYWIWIYKYVFSKQTGKRIKTEVTWFSINRKTLDATHIGHGRSTHRCELSSEPNILKKLANERDQKNRSRPEEAKSKNKI